MGYWVHVLGLHGQFGLLGVLLWCQGMDLLRATFTSPVPSPSRFLLLILSLILLFNTLSLPLRPALLCISPVALYFLLDELPGKSVTSVMIATYVLENWTPEIRCLIS